ncbi:MAG: anti-sigma factor family protein [Kofleriaceae bacterium]
MTPTETEPGADLDIDDEILATLSDYLDGALPAERRSEVEAKLASDDAWKRVHGELVETRDALSGLQRARAPQSFDQDVTSTIHRRSAGKFFGRRTLGDRVPFGVLLVIALALMIPIGYLLWSSSTGSLKRDHASEPPPIGSQSIVPRP